MARYLCVAENKVGSVEKLFSLTVQGNSPNCLFIFLIRITVTQIVVSMLFDSLEDRCANSFNLHVQRNCRFLFLVPPTIIGDKEEEVSVIEGHMVSLLCDVQAYPSPEITWTRDGQVLQFSTGMHILPGQTWATRHT